MDTQAYSRRELIHDRVPAIEQFCFAAAQGPEVEWTDNDLAEVIRLRLVTRDKEPFYEVLYCFGRLKDNRPCRVALPFECSTMPRSGMREHLAKTARQAGLLQGNREVYLSLFRALSTLE